MARRWLAALLLLGIYPSILVAESSSVALDGFATLGVVGTDLDHADFVADAFEPEGAGYTRDWSLEVDSRLGLQWSANPGGRVSGVVQIIAEQQADDEFVPDVEWANISVEVANDFSVRAGRIVLPIFINTQFRKVGFALPWVRPPPEVYGLVPATHSGVPPPAWPSANWQRPSARRDRWSPTSPTPMKPGWSAPCARSIRASS